MKEFYEKQIEKKNALIAMIETGYRAEVQKCADELKENISAKATTVSIGDLVILRDAYSEFIDDANKDLKYYERQLEDEERKEIESIKEGE